jgi:hypothetical protein
MISETEIASLTSRILDRNRAKLQAKSVIDLAGPLLKEIVDFGSATYASCLKVTEGEGLHKPALALYHHVLQMTDGIQVLIENSCVGPVVPLSRSALEAVLSLEYLFKDYENRSLIWRYYRLRKNLQQFDWAEQDEDVKAFERSYFGEPGFEKKSELRKIRERVESDKYRNLHDRLKDDKKVPDLWCKWVKDGNKTGPPNLAALAQKLGMTLVYKIVYKPYSRFAHADTYPYSEDLRHFEGML